MSRVIATLKDGLEAWRTRSLADLDIIYVVASGQIKLRRIDGWRKIAAVLSQHTAVAA